MNKRYLILGGIVLVVILLLVWAMQRQESFSWRETYKIDSNEPYGLYAAHQLLGAYTAARELQNLEDSLTGHLPEGLSAGPANYVFIGEGLFMRPTDRDALLAFVEAGNTAFLSAKVFPYDLMFYLYYEECDYVPWEGLEQLTDSLVNLNFSHPSLRADRDFPYPYIQDFRPVLTTWDYFPAAYFCDQENGLVPIGTINDRFTNMAQIRYGEGYFYLHSQPLAFTNYFLVKPRGRAYAEGALSYLNDGPVYWDEFSRIPETMARQENNPVNNSASRLQSDSPLRYILEQPPLAWAWYTLAAMALLYLLFRTKRRQRVIPVVQPLKNTSLQFVQTIGWLYFQRAGHQQLAVQAIKLLRTHVKERYGLQWREHDEQFVTQLSNRAGVDEELVRTIALDVQNIPRYTGLVETELVKFHQRLERFYQAAK
jgi:hypothetical protein